jgi:hypothetical protein
MHDDDIKLNSILKGGKTRKSRRRRSRVSKRKTIKKRYF